MAETDWTRGIILCQKKKKRTKRPPNTNSKGKEKRSLNSDKKVDVKENKPIKLIEKEIFDWIIYGSKLLNIT